MSQIDRLYPKVVQTSHKRLTTWLCALIRDSLRPIHVTDEKILQIYPDSLKGTACKGFNWPSATFGHGMTCS
ncbi:hypothetical protein EMIT0P2_200082 [Pseudomonas sp. IT-P2]